MEVAEKTVWKPSSKRKEDKDWIRGTSIMLAMRSKINKLTEQNYEKLSAEIFRLDIDTKETMEGLVDLLFKNMIYDATFRNLYGRLFQGLMDKKIKNTDSLSTDRSSLSFKYYFITKCDEEFRQNLLAIPNGNELQSKYIRGTVKMIGSLYIEGIIGDTLIKKSLEKLITAAKESPQSYATENFCHLIETIATKSLTFLSTETKNSYITILSQLLEPINKFHGKRVEFLVTDAIARLQ